MTEIPDMGFTELIQQPESRERDCERRLRLNTLSGYLGRIAGLDYVPQDCLNFRMSLPPRPPLDFEPVERAQDVQITIRRSMAARAIHNDIRPSGEVMAEHIAKALADRQGGLSYREYTKWQLDNNEVC